MIELANITKQYGKKQQKFTALDDVTLSIEKGKSVAIIGKSGSGKSTLMHIMSGLDHPTRGSVTIDGDNIFTLKQKQIDSFRSQKIGFIFQSFFVQANESCYDNVSLPLEIANVPLKERKQKIMKALKAVDLGDKYKQHAKNLSGGQKQRLAIARAIVTEPRVLFADEPTGNLDSTTGELIENLLFSYVRDNDATLVVVTHDDELANKCDKKIRIKDGKIIENSDKSKRKVTKR